MRFRRPDVLKLIGPAGLGIGAVFRLPVFAPFGPFEDFAECIAAMRRQGHTEDEARRICGALEERLG